MSLTEGRNEKLKGFAYLGLGGTFLLILGIIAILNISPYKDCGLWDFFCQQELKTPNELFLDYLGPVFIIIIGSLGIIVLIITQSASVRHYLHNRS